MLRPETLPSWIVSREACLRSLFCWLTSLDCLMLSDKLEFDSHAGTIDKVEATLEVCLSLVWGKKLQHHGYWLCWLFELFVEICIQNCLVAETCFVQKCSVCGTQTTPVWRRIDKQLVCNACGLRKRRSAKKKQDARQERRPKMPMAPLSLAYDPSMPHMEPEPEHEPHVHEEEQIQNDMPEQE